MECNKALIEAQQGIERKAMGHKTERDMPQIGVKNIQNSTIFDDFQLANQSPSTSPQQKHPIAASASTSGQVPNLRDVFLQFG